MRADCSDSDNCGVFEDRKPRRARGARSLHLPSNIGSGAKQISVCFGLLRVKGCPRYPAGPWSGQLHEADIPGLWAKVSHGPGAEVGRASNHEITISNALDL